MVPPIPRDPPKTMAALHLRDEQQLAGGPAVFHVGMGLRHVRQSILAPDPDLELPFRDPVE